ncbi:FAD-dependent oxidoreductase [Mesoterricola sediminis]|uniref:NADH dehydrogenase n=1 Tax=Mesoterricola sediminis TaxID=2927980 RepID=A0AA48H7F4_9BACT|nr:FAD-dependent oxidoreductase [Mesoterricola sediminis]BDU77338.1 NADH dehydrogenase [Mesoterricola sediminis]
MNSSKRIVIVGGVAGGASAAARARRLSESAEITLFERGPYVSFANCGLPYHIAGVIPERKKLLVQTPESLMARFNLEVQVNTEVEAVDPAARTVTVRNLKTGQTRQVPYDALVLSPGAEPVRPPIPGAADPRVRTLRNMGDMDAILAALADARRTLVVGAGYIGLEMAEAFRHRGLDVVLVERLEQVMSVADPDMVGPLHDELRRNGVDLRLGCSVESFEAGAELRALLSDGSQVACDLAILAIGVRPETALARKAGLELGPTGGIRVDEHMRTSEPGIWAVGDAVEVRDAVLDGPALIPLAGPANRQGRIAADDIFGRPSTYKGTQGTAVCKVFDLAFAMTGQTEKGLQRLGVPFRKIYVHPADHATYYPGAHPISLKLLFEPGEGHLLGAQAVGAAGADKRIDVLATAMRGGLTVFDLEDAELCYAPPFGSAKDPINMAGFVAANVLRGDVALWEPEELATLREDQVLMDVRTLTEHRAGTIPGAELAPVDELRDRLDDLDPAKEYLVFCQVGLRGYVASRLLSQLGFRVRNLSGGYKRWQMWKGTAAGLAAERACGEDGTSACGA